MNIRSAKLREVSLSANILSEDGLYFAINNIDNRLKDVKLNKQSLVEIAETLRQIINMFGGSSYIDTIFKCDISEELVLNNKNIVFFLLAPMPLYNEPVKITF